MKISVRHLFHYIVLCTILSVIIFFLIFYNGNPVAQKYLIILAGSWYIFWGYIHHYKEKSLDLSIILEYLLFGLLGSLLLIGLV